MHTYMSELVSTPGNCGEVADCWYSITYSPNFVILEGTGNLPALRGTQSAACCLLGLRLGEGQKTKDRDGYERIGVAI